MPNLRRMVPTAAVHFFLPILSRGPAVFLIDIAIIITDAIILLRSYHCYKLCLIILPQFACLHLLKEVTTRFELL